MLNGSVTNFKKELSNLYYHSPDICSAPFVSVEYQLSTARTSLICLISSFPIIRLFFSAYFDTIMSSCNTTSVFEIYLSSIVSIYGNTDQKPEKKNKKWVDNPVPC